MIVLAVVAYNIIRYGLSIIERISTFIYAGCHILPAAPLFLFNKPPVKLGPVVGW